MSVNLDAQACADPAISVGHRVTPHTRTVRNKRIYWARERGDTWPVIAARFKLSIVTCMKAYNFHAQWERHYLSWFAIRLRRMWYYHHASHHTAVYFIPIEEVC